ncbi:hypothetical protein MTO96_029405 [Rhipicephalus appendiculatus]
MALPLIQPPKHFEPGSNPAEAWSEWKAAYQLYEAACEYSTKPEATRRALLLHVMGPTARKIVETFRFPSPAEGEQRTDTVAAIFERFDERYLPYKNVTQATAIFNTMSQKDNQPIDDFIAELQHQAAMCDFGDKHDRLLGDRIIVGIRDAALRERLFRERDLTLEKIIATCRAAEISKQHVSSLASTGDGQEATVDNLSKKGKQFRHTNKQHPRGQPAYHRKNRQATETLPQRTCGRCGTVHQPRQCPAYGSTCYACGKFGHYASVCRQKQRTVQKKVHVLDQEDDSDKELSLGSLTVDTVESASSDWFESVEVNGRVVNFKLDTGSDVNILPEQLVLNWKPKPTVRATKAKVTTYLDALSRAPNPAETIKSSDQEYQVLACTLVQASTPKLAEIRNCTAADSTLQCVASYIQKGWPDKISKVPAPVKPYYSIRSELYATDGFLCYGERLIVPTACQKRSALKTPPDSPRHRLM